MGNTIWIQSEIANEDNHSDDLSFLCRHLTELDKNCKKAGVKKLSDFQDISEISAEFGLDVDPVVSNPMELLTSLNVAQMAITDGSITMEPETISRLEEELKYAMEVCDQCARKGEQVLFKLLP